MAGFQVDSPPNEWPSLEQLACAVWVIDRRRRQGISMLRQAIGDRLVAEALASPGRWLIGVTGRTARGVCTVATDDALIQAHRELLEIYGSPGTHIEMFHYLEPDLLRRVVEDSRRHALRIVPVEASA
jgi:hypothetical protein